MAEDEKMSIVVAAADEPFDPHAVAVEMLKSLRALNINVQALGGNVEILGHEVKRFSGRLSEAEEAIEDLKELKTQVVAGVYMAPPPTPTIDDEAPPPMRPPAKSVTSEVRDSVRAIGFETKKQTPLIAEAVVEAKKQTPMLEQVLEGIEDAKQVAQRRPLLTLGATFLGVFFASFLSSIAQDCTAHAGPHKATTPLSETNK